MSYRRLLLTLPYLASLITLLILSSATSWFNIVENTFSDLGRIRNGLISVVFNGLVSSTGCLLILYSTLVFQELRLEYRLTLGLAGYFLTLIGVYPEDYGRLHFYVSLVFFLLGISYMVLHVAEHTIVGYAIAALGLLNFIPWSLHFALSEPRGAAIPELVSLLSLLIALAYDAGRLNSS